MDYSKLMASTSDEDLIVALIEAMQGDVEVMAEELRQAFKGGYLRSIGDSIVESLSEEIELSEVVSEAEDETLKLNSEEFKGEVA